MRGKAQRELELRQAHEIAAALLDREHGHGRFGADMEPVGLDEDEVQAGQQNEMGQHANSLLRERSNYRKSIGGNLLRNRISGK